MSTNCALPWRRDFVRNSRKERAKEALDAFTNVIAFKLLGTSQEIGPQVPLLHRPTLCETIALIDFNLHVNI